MKYFENASSICFGSVDLTCRITYCAPSLVYCYIRVLEFHPRPSILSVYNVDGARGLVSYIPLPQACE